jgi:ZIP family zinc transporter
MPSSELTAFLLVIGAGLSTCIGGAVVYSERLIRLTSCQILGAGLGLSSGVMLYVSFVEIFVKSYSAFEDYGCSEVNAKLYATLSFFAGCVIMMLLDKVVHLLDPGDGHCVCGERIDFDAIKKEVDRLAEDERVDVLTDLRAQEGRDHCPPTSRSAPDDGPDYLELVRKGENTIDVLPKSSGDLEFPSSGAIQEKEDGSDDTVSSLEKVAKDRSEEYKEQQQEVVALSLQDKRLHHMGLMTAIAIGLHNFPEGLATYVAAVDDVAVGGALAVAIAIHNIPEGLCVSMPIYFATGNRHKAFIWSFISGLSELFGAAIGWAVLGSGDVNQVAYGVLFGMVAGMMVYIVINQVMFLLLLLFLLLFVGSSFFRLLLIHLFVPVSNAQLLPTAHRYDPKDRVVSIFALVGMVVMAASLILFLL